MSNLKRSTKLPDSLARMRTDTAVAKILLERGATALRPDQPFRYSSGILSPIYNDLRVLMSYPDDRKKILALLSEVARSNYRRLDAVAGTATAGIPWASWLAAEFNLPMTYVRDKPKQHGQQNQIEGVVEPGSRTLVVEDLVSTGQSVLGTVETIRQAGAEPVGIVGIFTYQMESSVTAFKAAGIALHTLTNFRTLVDMAVKLGRLTAESQEKVLDWATDPAGWGKQQGLE
jgi:orotate phosphoribosyltransferase